MTSATEFRQFAEECLRSAELAKTEQEKKAFLDMARAWTQAAVESGGRVGTVKQGDRSSHRAELRVPGGASEPKS